MIRSMVARGTVIIVVMTLVTVAVIGVTEGDWPLVAGALVASLAFGSTLMRTVPRRVRLVGFAAQLLALLVMAATMLVTLVVGKSYGVIVWWSGIVAGIVFLLGVTATIEGYRVYRRS